ncbi:MAG TPA: hypothetical protein VED65_00300 [Candidatus Bathyarchaeia archaeon]|nr:hypothetical protein [Candidatus Bathyarchaeia archaeon]
MLKPATKKRLAKLALQSGRSANYLVADAVETYLADQERLRVDLRFSAFACGFLLFLSPLATSPVTSSPQISAAP